MKPHTLQKRGRCLSVLLVICLAQAFPAHGDDLPFIWDNSSGDSLWNYTSQNWSVFGDAPGSALFSNGLDVTFFGGTAGTITIEPDTVEPGIIHMLAGDYTFQGGALTGAAQIVKQGSGTLTLASPNAHTGGVVIISGVVNSAAQGAMGPGPVVLDGGEWHNSQPYLQYRGELHVKTAGAVRTIGSAEYTIVHGPIVGNADLTISGNGFTITRDNSATFHGDWHMSIGDMFDFKAAGSLGTGTLYWHSGLIGSWYPSGPTVHTNNIVMIGTGYHAIRRTGGHAFTLAGIISGEGQLKDSEPSSVGTALLILSGENTYSGNSRFTNDGSEHRNVRLYGSLANANIHLESTLRGGSNPGQQGTINFNIVDDTTDLIQVYSGGHLYVDDLILKVNLSGSQTLDEYVIADYTSGLVSGGNFHEVQGLGDPQSEGAYRTGAVQWSIHYAGTDTNPGNKIVISKVIIDAMMFLLR